MRIPSGGLLLLALLSNWAVGASPTWIDPAGIPGTIVLSGGDTAPESVQNAFGKLAGGASGKLVVLAATNQKADTEDLAGVWQKAGLGKVTVLVTRDRKKADDAEFVKPLAEATAIWLAGTDPASLTEVYLGTAVEKEVAALLKRGGVVGGSSAGTAILSKIVLAGTDGAKLAAGFDTLPDALIAPHFTQRKRQDQLHAALGKHHDRFGIGIDEETALIITGRTMKALGKGKVSLHLAAANERPARTVELSHDDVADLTSWRRAARERSLAFPPREVRTCEVPKGSLVIVGGGGMPADVTKKFIDLAGGPDALIVIMPIAEGDGPPRPGQGIFFERAGAKNVKTLTARTRAEVEDPKNLAILKAAKGVWFGGGRQWRFVDGYEGTKAAELFHEVLKQGGVIGGSSAGASIQGDYMCRGNPLGNLDIMAEGYERGLAFLPGSAIDQHFAQRKRFDDMKSLVKTFPQYLGIGLDEATAIVVRGSVAEVMGKGEAHFYDATRKPNVGEREYQSLKAGAKYDVTTRKVLEK